MSDTSTVGTNDALNESAAVSVEEAAASVLGTKDGLASAVSAVQGSCEGVAAQACVDFMTAASATLDGLASSASSLSDAVTGSNATLHEADDASAAGWEEVG